MKNIWNRLLYRSNIYIRKIRFRIVFSFFILMVTAIGAVTFYSHFQYTQKISSLTDDQIDAIAEKTRESIIGFLKPVGEITKIVSELVHNEKMVIQNRHETALNLIGILKSFPQIDSFTIGTEIGDGFTIQLLPKGSSYLFQSERLLPESTKFRVHSVNRQKELSIEKIEYYDSTGKQIASEERNITPFLIDQIKSEPILFDPRKRIWYQGSKERRGSYWTNIYRFSYGNFGITTSYSIIDSSGHFIGVAAADINVEALSKFFKNQSSGIVARSFLINQEGQVAAYPDQKKMFQIQKDGVSLEHIENIQELGISKVYKKYLEDPRACERNWHFA